MYATQYVSDEEEEDRDDILEDVAAGHHSVDVVGSSSGSKRRVDDASQLQGNTKRSKNDDDTVGDDNSSSNGSESTRSRVQRLTAEQVKIIGQMGKGEVLDYMGRNPEMSTEIFAAWNKMEQQRSVASTGTKVATTSNVLPRRQDVSSEPKRQDNRRPDETRALDVPDDDDVQFADTFNQASRSVKKIDDYTHQTIETSLYYLS